MTCSQPVTSHCFVDTVILLKVAYKNSAESHWPALEHLLRKCACSTRNVQPRQDLPLYLTNERNGQIYKQHKHYGRDGQWQLANEMLTKHWRSTKCSVGPQTRVFSSILLKSGTLPNSLAAAWARLRACRPCMCTLKDAFIINSHV